MRLESTALRPTVVQVGELQSDIRSPHIIGA
jgi:hypothetical protein